MCGIAGIIDFRGRPIPPRLLYDLCASLGHRGPDDRGTWQFRSEGFSAGLAHTRLAVIDPAPHARQPMIDRTGRWAITYNGELYNYQALRRHLPPGRTACDTEVALDACIAWGADALKRFDAMWALAFIDTAARSGHLSRDPFGIKPLYYVHHDHRLVFASELAALRRVPDVPLERDQNAVGMYLQLGFIPHPHTIYRHVRKLPPGHLLRFDKTGPMEPERFHHLPAPAAGEPVSYPEAVAEVRRLVQSAIDRQQISDVPLGAFLSGGLDSSIVVACMARRGSARVRTFTIGYADHPRYDEAAHAERVARHFQTEHQTFRLGYRDVLAAVEPMLNHLGEPFGDSSLLPTALVSAYTRRHVTVALSGDGGDELFGGYWRYLGHHYLDRYHRLPAILRRRIIEPLVALVPSARTTRRLDRIRQVRKLLAAREARDAMARHLIWARLQDADDAAALLGPESAARAALLIETMYRQPPPLLASHSSLFSSSSPILNSLNAILLADLAVGLPGDMLFKVDTASMFHSLEVRVPLLAPDLVAFVAGLPVEYKVQGALGKRILRDAFRDELPPEVLARRKMGFEVPVGEFLRSELRAPYHDIVTQPALHDLGLHPPTAARLYNEHYSRRRDRTELLWALFVLCWWTGNSPQSYRVMEKNQAG